MSNSPTFRQCLRPVDVLVIAFAVLLCFINLFSMGLIHEWAILVGINIFSCFGIAIISYLSETRTSRVIRAIHNWYPVPTIFLVFKEMYVIIQSIAHPDWDPLLIKIDHGMFGADPTVWLGMHASPVLTEILQIAYVSYYFIMLTVGIELFLRNEREKFSYIVFVIVYGFFLSYLGYLAVPAVGPRFTLHDFSALKSELPGVWLTNGLRDFIDAGESIPNNVSNAIVYAQRDAFHSGHTEMTLISVYLAFHYKLKSRWILLLFGTLLIISTVYLRYHYVIDVIGGTVFMLFTVWTAPKLSAWWEKIRG